MHHELLGTGSGWRLVASRGTQEVGSNGSEVWELSGLPFGGRKDLLLTGADRCR